MHPIEYVHFRILMHLGTYMAKYVVPIMVVLMQNTLVMLINTDCMPHPHVFILQYGASFFY